MKKLLIFALGALTLASCGKKESKEAQTNASDTPVVEIRKSAKWIGIDSAQHTQWAYDANIYELNVRQLSEEGTFAAVEERLETMKDCGIDIIWVMPCQPIGKLTRKGTLGSYYSIVDYCQINPEFGTMDDFKSFLSHAHRLGMKVILDWVANHTAPDSEWTKNEGWHYRDSNGDLMVEHDWTDISKLNYDNQDMRAAMKQAMAYWMDSVGIDGFRCDVAGKVPTDFWNDAMGELRAKHPNMFTLAEDEDKAQELTESAFDMYYGWELHHLMNDVAQGKKAVKDLWAYFNKSSKKIRPEAIRMNFTSNHDENSWNGTEYERLGDAADMFAAFTYVVPGMPMIYTGQPAGNSRRLAFFEKDCIDTLNYNNGQKFELYRSLNAFRHNNPALWSPELGAKMERLGTNNANIFACVRHLECEKNGDNTVIAIMNMSKTEQNVTVSLNEYAGEYTCLCGKQMALDSAYTVTMTPWQYFVLAK